MLDNCFIEAGVRFGDGVTLSHVTIGRDSVIPSKVSVGARVIIHVHQSRVMRNNHVAGVHVD